DRDDIVGLLLHSGPNPRKSGGTMMGGGKHADPSTSLTGNQLAKAANDGNVPILVISGCASDWCAKTFNKKTGALSFGTTARTYPTEESEGFVEIVRVLAHGGTPETAAEQGSEEIKTLPGCSPNNPGCN